MRTLFVKRSFAQLSAAWLRQRAASQNVVEYGLIVAVASLAIIAGLNSLTPAVATYFQRLTPRLYSSPAHPSPFHYTTEEIACGPQPYVVNTTLTCTATVYDKSV